MLEILKTHLRKKTAEIAAAHNVNKEQIEIVYTGENFFYRVYDGKNENELKPLKLI